MKKCKAPKVLINEEFIEFCGDQGIEPITTGGIVTLPGIEVKYEREVYSEDTVYRRLDGRAVH